MAVVLLKRDQDRDRVPVDTFQAVTGHRYCQALMRARHGEAVLIEPGSLACPAASVVEGPPEPLMWLALADVNRSGGRRRSGDTAVLQGTCVDATLIPYLEQRLNFSLGCYGCREATDLAPSEAVLGFPGALLEPLAQSLQELNVKAIPRSRSKSVWRSHVAARSSEG